MNTLREAAQAAPDAEVRAQHKEFARWFLELSDKSALASEYLAWLAWKAALAHPPRDEWREAVIGALEICMILNDANRDDPERAMSDLMEWEPRDEWRPASEPPEDGRDVVVWCAQERRAVHGMYVRRHPPVVGLVDGWVAPDASKLTHWRDVTPPTEGA